jgi:hypothetical protein
LSMRCAARPSYVNCLRRQEAADLSRERAGEFDRGPVLTLRPNDLQSHW